MSDNKKYYYLKLKDNFFDNDSLIVLESMPDGHLYSNILLKLYLRSLKHEGRLVFNDKIPYNSTILAQVTRHSVGVVEKALSVFRDLELIEVLDNGAIYMLDIQNFIGTSSTEADRKREYRARIEDEKQENGQMSRQLTGQTSDKAPPEIEIEIERELDLEKEIKTEKELDIDKQSLYDDVKNMFNSIAVDLPKIKAISEARKKAINARVKEHGIDLIRESFIMAQESDFLSGRGGDNWKASFDWIMNPNNFIKVVEGNYINKNKIKETKQKPITNNPFLRMEMEGVFDDE